MSKKTPIVDRLIAKVCEAESRGRTRYSIGVAAEMQRIALSRMLRHEIVPRVDTSARLAKALGYELVLTPPKRSKKSRG